MNPIYENSLDGREQFQEMVDDFVTDFYKHNGKEEGRFTNQTLKDSFREFVVSYNRKFGSVEQRGNMIIND